MDGTREYHILSKVSQKEKDIPHDNTYMWNLKYDTNELIYKTETDSQTQRTDLWLPEGRGGTGWTEWELWIRRCKLLLIYTE